MSSEIKSRKPTLKESVHYNIDNYLARGSRALFLSLLLTFLTALIVLAMIRIALMCLFPDSGDVLKQMWIAFLQLTAPGNMNQDTTSPLAFKLTAILAGFTGVVIFSTLIATLTTALNSAILRLKQGHSRVLEQGHTLILGWNHRIPEILRELVEANESEDDPVVVIMSEHDKPWMDEYLRENFKGSGNTRIVTRKGIPASPDSLEHVSVADAKSVIILANCDENAPPKEQLASDAKGIKIVLALETSAPEAEFPIVTELFLSRNRDVVAGVAPGRAIMIDSEEILAKVMVQTSRTSGLSVVYSELLSFEGCELYFHEAAWNGITFAQCQYHFPDGVPIGIRDSEGTVSLRPSLDTVLEDGVEVLIVAEDDSTIEFRSEPVANARDISIPNRRLEQKKERMLMLGWSPKASVIISEHAEYVLEGSEVTIALRNITPDNRAAIEELSVEVDQLKINVVEVDAFHGKKLATLDPFSYHDIIILPQDLDFDRNAERIDSETIIVLLLLRNMRKELVDSGKTVTTKIVTEVLDSNNQALIHQAGVNDFIISNRLVSMLFAQISEEPDIRLVYDDLFQEDGSEIYVKPARLYFDEFPQQVTFADLMGVAQKRDEEVCIGIKIDALSGNSEDNYGIKLIPEKNESFALQPDDALVVVAEDEM